MVLRQEITKEIKDLLKKNSHGMSITEIVDTTGINRNTAGRYLENLLVSGQVELRRFGMAKIYRLAQRVPLSAVLSISSELVLQLDYNLRIIFVNEPFLDLIGTEEKAVLGKNIEYTPVAMVFDEAFPEFIARTREGIGGREWSGEIALTRKNITVFCRIAPTAFEDGRRGVSVILEDITEKREAEKKIRESEDKYRKLVEISPDAVFLHRDGRIMYANPAAVALLGAPAADAIIGEKILDFVAPAFRDVVRRNIQADLLGRTSPWTELQMVRTDGATISVEGRGIATEIDGKPAVQVAVRDITEKKQAEEALKIRERQLFSIYSNIPDVLFYLSVEGENRFRFLTVNQSFLDKAHKTEEEVTGRYVHEVIPGPLYSRARERYNQAIRERKTVHWEEKEESPTGTRYGDCYVTAIFDEAGRATNIIGSVHDSTLHKRLEATLREGEERLRLLLESTEDLVFMQDPEGRYLYFNAAAQYGVSADMMLGSTPFDLLEEKTAEKLVERVKKVVNTGQGLCEESPLVWKGQTLWFSDSLSPMKDAQGTTIAVVTISRNITDRKKAEEQWLESEATARALINGPADSVLLTDIRGTILALNDTAAMRFGKRREDLTGMLAEDLVSKKVARYRRMLMDRLIATKQMVRFEDEREGRWYDTVAYPVIVGSGEVSRIAIISRDITDRKAAEDALRESEERYRQLVDTSPDSVIIHGDGKILYLNPAALTMVGAQDSREIIGTTTLDFVHPEYRGVIREDMKKILGGETAPPREVAVLRIDGTTVMGESRAVRTTFRGNPAIQVTIRDITERLQREMALRESEEKYRTLVNRANDLICVIQDGVVKMCNPSLTEAFGTSSDRILGKPFTDFVDEDFLPLVTDRYQRRVAGEAPVSMYQMKLKRRDGSRARVEVNASLISYEGRPADLVIIREIDNRQRHRRNREWRDDPGPVFPGPEPAP